ncbi:hypothetical protein BaRGS_00015187, partial [Batillaria attramentaria]
MFPTPRTFIISARKRSAAIGRRRHNAHPFLEESRACDFRCLLYHLGQKTITVAIGIHAHFSRNLVRMTSVVSFIISARKRSLRPLEYTPISRGISCVRLPLSRGNNLETATESDSKFYSVHRRTTKRPASSRECLYRQFEFLHDRTNGHMKVGPKIRQALATLFRQ